MERNKIEYDLTTDIFQLRTEVFVKEQNVLEEVEIEAEENRFLHCCIYKDDELIAYARVYISTPSIIGRVCVKKEYRGFGYGRKIMQFAESQIPEATEIFIHAQIQAQGFYRGLGYIPFGEPFIEANIEHIGMKKRKGI